MSQSTFLVNGRRVVHAQSNGFITGVSINFTGPNKTPVPYPVQAATSDLKNTCNGLFVEGNPCATIESYLSQCHGDEVGDGGGIFSLTIGGQCDFLTASPDTCIHDEGLLRVNGKPVLREGDLAVMNHRNSQPTPLQLPPQVVLADHDTLLSHPAHETSPTPYQLNCAVLGTLPLASHEELVIWNEQGRHRQLLAQKRDDANAHWKRVSFSNLTDVSWHLGLSIPTETGEPLLIPFSMATQHPVTTDTVLSAYHQEQNIVMPVKFTTHLTPEDGRFTAIKGDLSDILRLPSRLRHTIYKALQARAFETSPWYDLISPSLRAQVDACLVEQTEGGMRAGYLYIFLDGTLWRELHVITGSMCCEVDLGQYAGQDKRRATGLPSAVLYLPSVMAFNAVTLEIAYSPVQWSWARIQYFGGVDKNDVRFSESALTQPLQAVETLSKRRANRFIFLDLSPEACAVKKQKAGRILLQAPCPQQAIPVIYLPDPLAAIQHAMDDIAVLNEACITERLEQALVGLLQSDEAGLGVDDVTPLLRRSCSLAVTDAMADYFSLGMYRYDEGFQWLGQLSETFSTELGLRYMATWLMPKHPFYPLLFPTATRLSDALSFDSKTNRVLSANGDGQFNGLLFAHSWHVIDVSSFEKMVHAPLDALPDAIHAIAIALAKAIAHKPLTARQQAYEQILQLYQASKHPVMSVIKLGTNVDLATPSHGVLGVSEPTPADKPGAVIQGPVIQLTPDVESNYFCARSALTKTRAIPWPRGLKRVLEPATSQLRDNAADLDWVTARILSAFSAMNEIYLN